MPAVKNKLTVKPEMVVQPLVPIETFNKRWLRGFSLFFCVAVGSLAIGIARWKLGDRRLAVIGDSIEWGLVFAIAALVFSVAGGYLWDVVERVTGRDLNGDGMVARKPILLGHAPAGPDPFHEFIRQAAIDPTDDGMAKLAKRLHLSQDQLDAYRDALIAQGWAEAKSSTSMRHGWHLLYPVDEVLAGASSDGDDG